jgi:hypothetical protein
MKFFLYILASSLVFIAIMTLFMYVNAPVFMGVWITICYVAIIAALTKEKRDILDGRFDD